MGILLTFNENRLPYEEDARKGEEWHANSVSLERYDSPTSGWKVSDYMTGWCLEGYLHLCQHRISTAVMGIHFNTPAWVECDWRRDVGRQEAHMLVHTH